MLRYGILVLFLITILHVKAISSAEAIVYPITIIEKSEYIEPISRKWFFIPDDQDKYSDNGIDTSSWKRLYIHYPWHYNKEFRDHRTNVWFRLPLLVKNGIRDISLFVPIHYRGAQFYFNGRLIHETRPYDTDGSSPPLPGKPTILSIPETLIHDGENVLSVRTRMLDNTSGFFRPIYIGNYEKIFHKLITNIASNIFFIAINFFISIYFLFIFLYRKKEIYFLYFSLFSFFLASWMIGVTGYILYYIDSKVVYNLFTYIGSISLVIALLLFIHSLKLD